MLVLSRRVDETVHLPDLRTKIEILKVRGQVVRIGIDAPKSVRVLRGELTPNDTEADDLFDRLHEMRNLLNSCVLTAEVVRSLLNSGDYEQAKQLLEETSGSVQSRLKRRGDSPEDRKRMLVVEDNPNERNLMAGLLNSNGFDVELAGDGAEAIDHLKSKRIPDYVLMDMNMPVCDGPTAVREIRSDPDLAGVRICAISGTNPGDVGVEIGPQGIDHWFPKPLNAADLMEELCQGQ